jgi:hypothetical protein
MIASLLSILDSTPVKWFFAAWTGVYLVQLLYKEENDGLQELLIVGLFFVGALIVLKPAATGATA